MQCASLAYGGGTPLLRVGCSLMVDSFVSVSRPDRHPALVFSVHRPEELVQTIYVNKPRISLHCRVCTLTIS